MKSPEPTSLKQIVAAHGRELAAIHRLLEEAAREAVKLHSPWGCWPKGGVFSGLTREKFLKLIKDCEDLAGTGVSVWESGEHWVRVWLPGPKWLLKLRSRPKVICVDDDDSALFDLDLGGVPRGFPVLLWRFNFDEDRLEHFTMARVMDLEWVMEAQVFEEIEITANLAAQAAAPAATVPGTGNDDDDLPDVVGRWDSDEPQSEDEATDATHEDSHDDEGDTAVGEDDN